MKKMISLIVLVSFSALQGCSAFKPSTQTVNIQCATEGVTLMINGKRLPCPQQYEAKRKKSLSIQAYKDGFTQYQHTIDSRLSTTAILDIVGGFLVLVPAVGLLTDGAWDLDETDLFIDMLPLKNSASL